MDYSLPKIQTREASEEAFAVWMKGDGESIKMMAGEKEKSREGNTFCRLIGFANEPGMKRKGLN